MELHSHEGEIPIPLNTAYGGGGGHGHGHMIHHDHHHHHPHNHIIPSSSPHPQIQIPSTNTNNNNVSSTSPSPVVPTSINLELDQNNVPYKKMVRYRECLKNHAASMGGNATDGCGEFMPSGEEGSIEALTCSACNCHRNFHRKEVEGEPNSNSSPCDCLYPQHQSFNRVGGGGGGRKMILGGHPKGILATPEAFGYPTSGGGTLIPSRPMAVPHHQMVLPYNFGGSLHSESDEQEEGNNGGVVLMGNISSSRPPLQQMVMMKKRFRTKFTQEQKEKMLNFAEKVGWKIQKQEEAVVQQFCQEIGVKRRVLKVWMHNNKHNLAKKIDPSSTTSA